MYFDFNSKSFKFDLVLLYINLFYTMIIIILISGKAHRPKYGYLLSQFGGENKTYYCIILKIIKLFVHICRFIAHHTIRTSHTHSILFFITYFLHFFLVVTLLKKRSWLLCRTIDKTITLDGSTLISLVFISSNHIDTRNIKKM